MEKKRGRPSKADLELREKAYQWECENGVGFTRMLHEIGKKPSKGLTYTHNGK